MPVKEITKGEDFGSELASCGSKLVVIDFTASWCPPCNRIKPFFDTMSGKYPEAVFLKVDVNKCEEIAASQGVTAMPTFIFYRNKIRLDKLQGSNSTALEEMIKRYYAEEIDIPGSTIKGQIDLIGFILKAECKALNESDEHPFSNCLSTKEGHLESECDEQLILPLTFTQAVKIHSIKIKAPGDKGPKTLKLFINQPNILDFDSASANKPVQEILLSEKDLTGDPVNLNFVKFQSVQNLYLFVQDNQSGSDKTRIDYLQLIGSPILTTKMDDFKRVAGSKHDAH